MKATTEWSDTLPTTTGTHLVQLVGDWFPKGDPNNIKHILVWVCRDEDTAELIKFLYDGRFLKPEAMQGWKWAKVIKAP